MKYILASGSPRRKELFQMITEDYEVITADVEEIVPEGMEAEQQSEYLAKLKAAWVAKDHPDALVVGCDTTVLKDGQVLGKPKDHEEAVAMLSLLSGDWHQVATGCSLIYGDKVRSFTEISRVRFYPLSEEEIEAYVATGDPFDKAGGYGIQTKVGGLLVKEISGDYYNVVGMPVARLYREIREMIGGFRDE